MDRLFRCLNCLMLLMPAAARYRPAANDCALFAAGWGEACHRQESSPAGGASQYASPATRPAAAWRTQVSQTHVEFAAAHLPRSHPAFAARFGDIASPGSIKAFGIVAGEMIFACA